MKTLPLDPVKRNLLKLCGALPLFAFVSACSLTGYRSSRHPQLTGRFKGTGGVGVLYVDSLVEKEGVTIYNEHSTPIFRSATLGPRNTSEYAYPGGERGVPETIRVTWREGKFTLGTWDWEGGTITGDYTVPVAARIPDAVLDEIRKNGGQLRLKIRITDDGALIGWDIVWRLPGSVEKVREAYKRGVNLYIPVVYKMTGGDFKEARPANYLETAHGFERLPYRPAPPLPKEYEDAGLYLSHGQLMEKGWYIDPHTGQKIETDY